MRLQERLRGTFEARPEKQVKRAAPRTLQFPLKPVESKSRRTWIASGEITQEPRETYALVVCSFG